MEINRVWAMPSANTFTIKPIAELLKKYEVGINWRALNEICMKQLIELYNEELLKEEAQ
jgi:hypothetical protein